VSVNLINNKVIVSDQYVVQQDKRTLTNVWGRRKAPQPPGDKKASSNFDWQLVDEAERKPAVDDNWSRLEAEHTHST